MTGAADLWAKGDYPQVARELQPIADALVEACAIGAGDRVLDVAAGDGNAAVAAARRGAAVTALEISPPLLARGVERTAGSDVRWVEGDAGALPFAAGEFDAVLSVHGAMYVPDPDAAARELFRVARSGAVVGLTAWTPEGFQGTTARALKRILGQEGGHEPSSWGEPSVAERRLRPFAAAITTERRELRREYAGVDEWWAFADRNAPPLAAAREAVSATEYAAIRDALSDVAAAFAEPTPAGIAIRQEYLLVVARAAG